MTTLTRLEDLLLHSREEAKGIILQLRVARQQLEENNGKIQEPQQYQQNTLLLEAIEQAENIINTIYYRYHNSALVVSEQERESLS
ncbi:TPA: type III secretion system chaperone SsaE [Salmonella enterica subsp. salamae]|nr:type III secretion system chaperone SsaE [Salmonella enterica subsp. salamae]ECI0415799.1 type III secretion system chaperone SsaE [Salmonella enterica subsp. salamae]EDW4021379.1 type III secretion system chaperone SsaE [Salmonella enterica subsp. salamae]SQH40765.1 type III secretion system chaperone SsaE [Salmonella enterica]HAU3358941.1 type III secretion system chaperone SsaE [Salmonella enterica subsp. salamae]